LASPASLSAAIEVQGRICGVRRALAAVGYNWTQNIATTVGYRVLYTYDRQDTGDARITAADTSFRFQQWLHGPFAALKYSL
jgi:HD-like signal output (HDOD) protein